MMRYYAEGLSDIYFILEGMDKPVAVFDFISGEMGYEALCAQSIGGKFYDDYADQYPVVALTWKGCAVWYENVSDHQIELQDELLSTTGNLRHRGEPRWAHLVLAEHRERIDRIDGVAETFGPCYWSGGHVDDERLAGFVRLAKLRASGLQLNRAGLVKATADRLERTGYVFQPSALTNIKKPYVAVFDRNEPGARKAERNTQEWQLRWLYDTASRLGMKLVIFAGLHPRGDLPKDVIHLTPGHRNMDLLCSVVRNAVLFAAPPCGAAEVACIFGCDFLALGHMGVGMEDFERMQQGRGFNFFGPLMDQDGNKAREVVEFLEAKCCR